MNAESDILMRKNRADHLIRISSQEGEKYSQLIFVLSQRYCSTNELGCACWYYDLKLSEQMLHEQLMLHTEDIGRRISFDFSWWGALF